MGIVSQHPILFNASFTENIAFGVDLPPDMEKVKNAALNAMHMISFWNGRRL